MSRGGPVDLPDPRDETGTLMSDWESIQADAREEVAESRVCRINARRSTLVDSASEEPPSYICESCGIDGDCKCSDEEAAHEDEAGCTVGRGDEAQAVRPARRTENQREEVQPWKSLSLTD